MYLRSIGEYNKMFETAKLIGKKLQTKSNVDVYKVETQLTEKLQNGESYQIPLNYLASFKNGKPFKIVDQSLNCGKRGRRIYNAEKNTITDTARTGKFFSKTVKNAETGEVKGKLDLYTSNDGYVDFMATYTPQEGMRTGQIKREYDGIHLWVDDGFGFGPYSNIKSMLRKFNIQVHD